jgi:hypothetical protein
MEGFGLSHVRVPQDVRQRVRAGGSVQGTLRPKKPREPGFTSDCTFDPEPVIECEGCGNEMDERSQAEGRDRCSGCRAAEEWEHFEGDEA